MNKRDNINKVWRWLALVAFAVGALAGSVMVHWLYKSRLHPIVIAFVIFASFLTLFAARRALESLKK